LSANCLNQDFQDLRINRIFYPIKRTIKKQIIQVAIPLPWRGRGGLYERKVPLATFEVFLNLRKLPRVYLRVS